MIFVFCCDSAAGTFLKWSQLLFLFLIDYFLTVSYLQKKNLCRYKDNSYILTEIYPINSNQCNSFVKINDLVFITIKVYIQISLVFIDAPFLFHDPIQKNTLHLALCLFMFLSAVTVSLNFFSSDGLDSFWQYGWVYYRCPSIEILLIFSHD